MHKRQFKDVAVIGLTATLIAGAIVQSAVLRARPANADEYQRRVREAYEALPGRIDTWVGEAHPVPRAAVAVLHPNVAESREYLDIVSGTRAQVLLVQCNDARDIFGHYPPNCYPGQGWVLQDARERDWTVDGVRFTGMQYRFSGGPLGPDNRNGIVVQNFMLLPDGSFARDMQSLRKLAVRWRFYGAGQLQVLTGTEVPDEERERAFATLVGGYMPVIRAIGSGVAAVDAGKASDGQR